MNYRVCDLFAGAGGFSLGFKLAGLEPTVHLEIDKYASETLKANFTNSRIITDDIRYVDPHSLFDTNADVIIGGPPCQGFSVAGSSQYGINDERNELVFWYLHFVSELKPKIAIIENVPNVLTKKSKDGKTFLSIIETIGNELGYKVEHTILNAADFGVPQARRRAFIVLHSPNVEFSFPSPICSNERDLFSVGMPYVTVDEALSDLPEIKAGECGSGLSYKSAPSNSFQEYCRENNPVVTNHESMRHTDRLVERFKIIKPGQSLKDVPLEFGQIAYGSGEKVNNPFKYNNYRLEPDKPALTIPASFQSLFVHPSSDRNLTAREGARLMSYPDYYVFKGPKTMMSWETGLSQYNQIGNSVCPLLGKAIGQSVKEYLARYSVSTWQVKSSKTLERIICRVKKPKYDLTIAQSAINEFLLCGDDICTKIKEMSCYDERSGLVTVDSVSVPLKIIEFTVSILRQTKCPICNSTLPPFGNHTSGICILISKSDIDSLVKKKKDNGLDFHLRVLSGVDKSYANDVVYVLSQLGFIDLETKPSPRTGKAVKAARLKPLYQKH